MALAVAVTVSACGSGGDTEPSATQSVGVSASPSVESETLTDDELRALLPPGAERDDEVGAIATARYFVILRGTLFDGKNFDQWQALSTPDCSFCIQNSDEIRDLVSQGIVRSGGQIMFRDEQTRTVVDSQSGNIGVFLYFQEDPSTETNPEGGVESFSGGEIEVLVEMVLVNEIWRVNGVNVTSL